VYSSIQYVIFVIFLTWIQRIFPAAGLEVVVLWEVLYSKEYSSTLKKEVAGSSDMLVKIY
jgi:hypothetical protein